jgi:hypothetical protein
VQNYARKTIPAALQPVDEDVTLADIVILANETRTNLLYYREVGIWRYGDYAHVVLGRYRTLTNVKLREYKPAATLALKEGVKRLLGRGQSLSLAGCDYLGSDVLRRRPRRLDDRFRVSAIQRRRLAASWLRGKQLNSSLQFKPFS